jgi:anti-anti-sigma factor
MNGFYINNEKNLLIFHPSGKLQIEGAIEFEKNIQQAIKENSNYHLLINLMDVEYLSSSCLRILMKMKLILNKRGNKFILSNVNEYCKKVFYFTNYENFFPMYNSENEAIASLN